MSIKEELLALQAEQGGILQVDPAIEWARRNPGSALYQSIPWDDAKAAQEHRRHIVRQLIAIHIVNVEGKREVVSLSIDRIKPGGGYRSVADVVATPPLREIMLQDALNELARVQAKYATVAELVKVWEEVAKVRERQEQPTPRKGRKGGGEQARA